MTHIRNFLLFIACISSFECSNKDNERGVEQAMKQYDHLIKKMDADSIALLYTPDGDLGTMAHGRDSIKMFLSRFKDIKVLYQHSVITYMKITADTALQRGIYRQMVLINGKDTMRDGGEFTAIWWWIEPGVWRIKKMMTTPN